MRVLSMLCLLTASASLLAADDKKPSAGKTAAKVRVTGLIIHKPPPAKPGGMMYAPNGTTLELLVSESGRFILGLDPKASKLESFTDDKKNNLAKKSGTLFGGQPNWINLFATPMGAADGEYGLQITAAGAPGKGASKILAKGSLAVKFGAGEKTLEKQEIALKQNEEVKAADFKISINYTGTFSTGVSVVSTEPLLKTIEFFDAAGKPVKPTFTNRVSMPGFGPNRKPQTTVSYNLGGNLKNKLAFKLTYFSKTETVSVPFDVRVGLDLE